MSIQELADKYVQLGADYERALQATPRNYDVVQQIENRCIEYDAESRQNDMDFYLLFRRGRNQVRDELNLDHVADW